MTVADVLATPWARAQVQDLSRTLGRPLSDVFHQVTTRLSGMVVIDRPFARTLYRMMMRAFYGRAWQLRVDVGELGMPADLPHQIRLVFMPSHRSYADPLVLDAVLRLHGFPPTYVLAGSNLAFWPIGPLARRANVVFIRRTFRDDPYYKVAVRVYLAHLLAGGANLQFYVEGGRTRTGALGRPRLGLVRYLMDLLQSGACADIRVVPVSITYDHLPEATALVNEQVGVAKKAERLGRFLGLLWAQRRELGAVHVRFGEPLPLRPCSPGRPANRRAGGLAGVDARAHAEEVALEVCDRVNRVTPLTSRSLLTLVLLASPTPRWTAEQAHSALFPLLDHVRQRRLPESGCAGLGTVSGVHLELDRLVAHGVAARSTSDRQRYLLTARDRRIAAFYRNSVLHWFVARAVVELALLRGIRDDTGERGSAVLHHAWRLRTLFDHDVVFGNRDGFQQRTECELDLLCPHWRQVPAGEVRALLRGPNWLAAPNVLPGLLASHLLVARQLAAQDPAVPVDQDALAARCLQVGRRLLCREQLRYPEAVSLPQFVSALAAAAQRGLVTPPREGLHDLRLGYVAELSAVRADVRLLTAGRDN